MSSWGSCKVNILLLYNSYASVDLCVVCRLKLLRLFRSKNSAPPREVFFLAYKCVFLCKYTFAMLKISNSETDMETKLNTDNDNNNLNLFNANQFPLFHAVLFMLITTAHYIRIGTCVNKLQMFPMVELGTS